jgi:thymidylate synthase
MNTIDSKYQALLEDILDNGVEKQDRTGTGTISVFGRQIRHKMSQGFPLLTTKKMAWKTIVTELLWFLRGDTNIKFLLDYDCHIWDGDAFKNYTNAVEDIIDGYRCGDIMGIQPHIEAMFSNTDELIPLTKEEFISKIKNDKDFAKKWGDLGPIYGKQWRQWQGWMDMNGNEKGSLWYDQILQLVHSLKTNPDSRRLMVSAWNVAELDQMILPPCHYGFQVYTRELSIDERYDLCAAQKSKMTAISEEDYIKYNIPTRAISLMWNQRSVDTPLGLPFNIASYGLLLEIIAKEVNMVPDELIGNLGDCHIYKNQIDGVKEQLTREPFDLPTIKITERNWYQHEAVKKHLGPNTFNDKILSYRPECFELIGYQSHSKIKMPLSN